MCSQKAILCCMCVCTCWRWRASFFLRITSREIDMSEAATSIASFLPSFVRGLMISTCSEREGGRGRYRERDGEREGWRERGREREREREKARERVRAGGCVRERAREREWERERERVGEGESERERASMRAGGCVCEKECERSASAVTRWSTKRNSDCQIDIFKHTHNTPPPSSTPFTPSHTHTSSTIATSNKPCSRVTQK